MGLNRIKLQLKLYLDGENEKKLVSKENVIFDSAHEKFNAAVNMIKSVSWYWIY